MTPLQQRILDHLFDTGRAQSLSAVTVALKEPQGDVYTALNTLRIQGAVVLNGYSKYRLENATKTRMGEEVHDVVGVPRHGLPEPVFDDRQTTTETTQANVISQESDNRQPEAVEVPTCLNPEAIGDPNTTPVVQLPPELASALVASGQCTIVGSDEPTNSSLDAAQAQSGANPEARTTATTKADPPRTLTTLPTGETPPLVGGGGVVDLVPAEPERSGPEPTRSDSASAGPVASNALPNVGEHPLSPELVEERLAGIPEPTDAELDAIEAEEAEEAGSVVDDVRPVPAGGKRCGYRSGRENIDGEPWTCDLEPGHSGAHVDFGIGSSEADDDEPSVYDVEAAGTGKFPPAIGLVPAEPENSAPSALREQGRSFGRAIGNFNRQYAEFARGIEDAGAEMREHVWGVARDRPTKGLRIEQVVKEFVELEARRQKLLDELGRLVG